MVEYDNSFFHHRYKGLTAAVFVPHQDDELNIAGALIYSLVKGGAKVKVVYTTNGDCLYDAKTRLKQASAALAILGVPREDIIFLGYGDSLGGSSHLFYHKNDVVTSPAGHSCTYGDAGFYDYSFLKNGKHSEYTADNYLGDILSVIEDTMPGLIVTTDLDEHADHKMLSLYIDRAVGIAVKKHRGYYPQVWKSFAYALSYSADSDYSALNNKQTQKPVIGVTDRYNYEFIDKGADIWAERIRLPLDSRCHTPLLKESVLARAMRMHTSQPIDVRTDRIINSDSVFFSRRSDNMALFAKVSTTSGNGEFLNDNMLIDLSDIDNGEPVFAPHSWQTETTDSEKTAVLEWDEPITVERIVLYGAFSRGSACGRLQAELDDGFSCTVTVNNNSSPTTIDTQLRRGIRRLRITVLSAEGDDFGIAQCEVYSSKSPKAVLKPYCKILIKDNFAYQYIIGRNTKKVPLGLYRYAQTGGITLSVTKGSSVIKDGVLYVDDSDSTIVLLAENAEGSVYDKAVITRASEDIIKSLRLADLSNKKYISSRKKLRKLYNFRHIVTSNGIRCITDKKLRRKLIGKIKRIGK